MGLFQRIFHHSKDRFKEVGAETQAALDELKSRARNYRMEVILLQRLISIQGLLPAMEEHLPPEKEKERQEVLKELHRYIDSDTELEGKSQKRNLKLIQRLERLAKAEKREELKEAERAVLQEFQYLSQDLAEIDKLIGEQRLMLGSLEKSYDVETARKIIEAARQEAKILFGVDSSERSEERMLKDILRRVDKAMSKAQ